MPLKIVGYIHIRIGYVAFYARAMSRVDASCNLVNMFHNFQFIPFFHLHTVAHKLNGIGFKFRYVLVFFSRTPARLIETFVEALAEFVGMS